MSTKVATMVPGNIWKVLVKEGDIVKKGDTLFIMEVMKTEVNHDALTDGKVSAVHIVNDQTDIEAGMVAIEID
jgi:biotin carboxyl carrier protein